MVDEVGVVDNTNAVSLPTEEKMEKACKRKQEKSN